MIFVYITVTRYSVPEGCECSRQWWPVLHVTSRI